MLGRGKGSGEVGGGVSLTFLVEKEGSEWINPFCKGFMYGNFIMIFLVRTSLVC